MQVPDSTRSAGWIAKAGVFTTVYTAAATALPPLGAVVVAAVVLLIIAKA